MYCIEVTLTLTLSQHPDDSHVEIFINYFGKMSAVTLWRLENAVCMLNTLLAPQWSSPIAACILVAFLCTIIYSMFSIMHTYVYGPFATCSCVWCGVHVVIIIIIKFTPAIYAHVCRNPQLCTAYFSDVDSSSGRG